MTEEKKSVAKYIESSKFGKVNIKAALIDMDGVLYDTMKYHTKAWHRLATELGIRAERDEFYLYEGMTGAATINLLYQRAFNKTATPDEAKRLYAQKARYFIECGSVDMMPDADRMLKVLCDHNLKRVLVTGSGQNSILDKINRDYPGVFDDDKRVTAHDVEHGKPHPEPYLIGMKKADCNTWECMVVENAPLGIESGRAAGCFVVGITTGPIPRSAMEEAGADIVYGSMGEFADALPKLLEALVEH